ncbi:hypothetical protein [Prauserella flavalba]|uniref:hypothetical protein n=1 Tax=Prauserella flavalba TaxID=1477506 RepID=UPI0011B3F2F9|nr:hypothetical protein [Prauserella flavalba]
MEEPRGLRASLDGVGPSRGHLPAVCALLLGYAVVVVVAGIRVVVWLNVPAFMGLVIGVLPAPRPSGG